MAAVAVSSDSAPVPAQIDAGTESSSVDPAVDSFDVPLIGTAATGPEGALVGPSNDAASSPNIGMLAAWCAAIPDAAAMEAATGAASPPRVNCAIHVPQLARRVPGGGGNTAVVVYS